MEYIKVSAKTVSDALIEAAIQLETSSDNIEYEVIENGSSGFLGFGSKPAVIKARRREVVENFDILSDSEPIEEKEVTKKETIVKEVSKKEIKKETITSKSSEKEARIPKAPVNKEEAKGAAEQFLNDIFKSMKMNVKIESSFDEDVLSVEMTGDDMGALIGKRGQTLDALQYLTSLVVNKGNASYTRVKLDTENYRNRRKETLENLAKNIAIKVKKTRRPVFLEPMNPYERRIIHSVLQNDPYVTTHSEGEEPYRKIVVALKK